MFLVPRSAYHLKNFLGEVLRGKNGFGGRTQNAEQAILFLLWLVI